MAEDKKNDIGTRSAMLRESEGVGDCGGHLDHFRRSMKEVAQSLPEDEVQHYKELAKVMSEARKAPPTPTAVFE